METFFENRTVVIESGDSVKEVEVRVKWERIVDRHYGADADGNRGVYREWLDIADYEILSPADLSESEKAAVEIEVYDLEYKGE